MSGPVEIMLGTCGVIILAITIAFVPMPRQKPPEIDKPPAEQVTPPQVPQPTAAPVTIKIDPPQKSDVDRINDLETSVTEISVKQQLLVTEIKNLTEEVRKK